MSIAPPKAEKSAVTSRQVAPDEDGMRLDRWFKEHFPGVSFGALNKLLRTGQVRIDGGRAKSNARLESGQVIRIPPLPSDAAQEGAAVAATPSGAIAAELKAMTLYEDDMVLVLNKPFGLAVQGGSGTVRHVDGMLEALRDKQGRKPRLVHRLDKDTSGVLIVAKTKAAATALAASFRARTTKKVYWALVRGVPKPKQGRISSYLAKGDEDAADPEKRERMRIAEHGERGADHALTLYNVIETAGRGLTWITLRPVTGRTHQLRAHCNHIGYPIIGDPKYFDVENWEIPGGIQHRLHLHARRLVMPHPKGGQLDVSAPLPLHMQQSWNLLGFSVEGMGDVDDEDEWNAPGHRGHSR
jgi:23S rRNA pseudouridine955/2504/2580 synthase